MIFSITSKSAVIHVSTLMIMSMVYFYICKLLFSCYESALKWRQRLYTPLAQDRVQKVASKGFHE